MQRLEYGIPAETHESSSSADAADWDETDEAANSRRPSQIQETLMRDTAQTEPIEEVTEPADEGPEVDAEIGITVQSVGPTAEQGLEQEAVTDPATTGKAAVGVAVTPPSIPDTATGSGGGMSPPPEGRMTPAEEGDEQPEESRADRMAPKIPTPEALADAGKDEWEQTLQRKGLPEELPANIAFTLALAKKYEAAADVLREGRTTEPTNVEIADYLAAKGAPQGHIEAVRKWGNRIAWTTAIEELPEERPAQEEVEVRRAVDNALSTLDTHEAVVLKARFGMGFDLPEGGIEASDARANALIAESRTRPLTLEEVGYLMGGMRREAIRGLEAKAKAKLRRNDGSETSSLR